MVYALQSAMRANNIEEVKRELLFLTLRDDWESLMKETYRCAIQLGNRETIKIFIKRGLSQNKLANLAGRVGHLELVQFLAARSPEAAEWAMHGAISKGQLAVVSYLLASGCPVDGTTGKNSQYRRTFLGKAASKGDTNIIQLLLQNGADIKTAIDLSHKKFRYMFYQAATPDLYSYWCPKTQRLVETYNLEECHGRVMINYNRYSYWCRDTDRSLCTYAELAPRRAQLVENYTRTIQRLFDHAVGVDFQEAFGGLQFLQGLDVSRFNFTGVSVDGKPVSREMLESLSSNWRQL